MIQALNLTLSCESVSIFLRFNVSWISHYHVIQEKIRLDYAQEMMGKVCHSGQWH